MDNLKGALLKKIDGIDFRQFNSNSGEDLTIVEPGYILNRATYTVWRILEKEMKFEELINLLKTVVYNNTEDELLNFEEILTEKVKNIVVGLYNRNLITINNRNIKNKLIISNEAKKEVELYEDFEFVPITQVDLIVTTGCNFRCKHCFIKTENITNNKSIKLQEWKDIIDKLSDNGLLSVIVTGGEPLTYNELPELLDYIDKKGMKIQLLTNGYLLNEEFIKKISKYKILVQVSLDGSSEKTNSKQRGEGNFDKVSDNIKLLKKYNIPVIVAVVLNKFNYNDIFNGSMTNLCEDLKVNTLAITPNVIKISNALKNEENFLNVGEVLDVIKFINDYNSSKHNNLNIILSVPPAFTEDLSISNVRKPRSRCRRGSNSFSIRPDGRIVVCSDFTELNYAEYEMGNILTDEFSTILNKLKKNMFRQKQ